MRNLILFFLRFNAFFLFLLLETTAIYFLVQKEPQKQIFLHSANLVSGSILKVYDGVAQYTRLKKANVKMANEIAWYKNRDSTSYVYTYNDREMPLDSVREKKYQYIAANVINNSIHLNNNYLTLDKGSNHGVEENTGVVCGIGIAGVVRSVSGNYAAAMSLLHQDVKVSAKIKSNNYFGSLVWKGSNPRIMDLDDIPQHVSIQKGDTVVTSGYSSLFPPGQFIGVIDDFWIEAGENFHTVKVELACELGNIEYAYVVKNLMKKEQKELEEELNYE